MLLFAGCLLVITPALAQKKFTISGIVKDGATGETLIGATITINKGKTQSGAAANAYGFYSLSAPGGDYTVIYSFVGYTPFSKQLSLYKDTVINISLTSKND